MQSAAINLFNAFGTATMLVCPRNMLTAAEQCSSSMHTKHMQHCHVHARQTHAKLSAACIPNTSNILKYMHAHMCNTVSCMHTKRMQHCQLHACRKKFLIEILEGTKVISRKKGFTTTTCVSGVAIGQQTKQFDNLPESAKVLSRPKSSIPNLPAQDNQNSSLASASQAASLLKAIMLAVCSALVHMPCR